MTGKLQTPNIVPFGKYKGQPVEVLAQDRPYLEWLSAQDWFRERYTGIYTLIVNNFTEATETPDHNALQVLFLDDDFCAKFITVLKPRWRADLLKELSDNIASQRRHIIEHMGSKWTSEALKNQLAEALDKLPGDGLKTSFVFTQVFEQGGIDVQLRWGIQSTEMLPWLSSYPYTLGNRHYGGVGHYNRLNIEIKPAVGDDYPAVLRQMRANGSGVLFAQSYAGIGATEAQFVKTFAMSNIKVIFRRAVDVVDDGTAGGWLTLDADQDMSP